MSEHGRARNNPASSSASLGTAFILASGLATCCMQATTGVRERDILSTAIQSPRFLPSLVS